MSQSDEMQLRESIATLEDKIVLGERQVARTTSLRKHFMIVTAISSLLVIVVSLIGRLQNPNSPAGYSLPITLALAVVVALTISLIIVLFWHAHNLQNLAALRAAHNILEHRLRNKRFKPAPGTSTPSTDRS